MRLIAGWSMRSLLLQSKPDQWELRGGVLEETVQPEVESITLLTLDPGIKWMGKQWKYLNASFALFLKWTCKRIVILFCQFWKANIRIVVTPWNSHGAIRGSCEGSWGRIVIKCPLNCEPCLLHYQLASQEATTGEILASQPWANKLLFGLNLRSTLQRKTPVWCCKPCQ